MYWNACAPIGTFGARWRERSEASAITIRIFPMGRIRLTSMGPGITVVRKNSVTHRKARGSIRDAIRQGSDWHRLHRIPRGDGANWPLAVAPRGRRVGNTRAERHVGAPGIVMGDPRVPEWIVDAMRIAGSANPDTLGESYQ